MCECECLCSGYCLPVRVGRQTVVSTIWCVRVRVSGVRVRVRVSVRVRVMVRVRVRVRVMVRVSVRVRARARVSACALDIVFLSERDVERLCQQYGV